MNGLREGIVTVYKPDRLLYRSDYPFTPATGVEELAEKMNIGLDEAFPVDRVRNGIYIHNAATLLRIGNT